MGEKRTGGALLVWAAELLDLPADVVAGLPRITLTGSRALLVENHRGILSYSDREIEVNGGAVAIRLEGDGLVLRAMNAGELLITGEIFKLEFRH